MRCAMCGRKLTVPKSVLRGIGPVCIKKYKKAKKMLEQDGFGNPCKVCGKSVPYFPRFAHLRLPCNHFCCVKDHCPFADKKTCPRERIFIKSDIYPLYKRKITTCSFCGKTTSGQHYRTMSKSKVIIECYDCRKKNRIWRRP